MRNFLSLADINANELKQLLDLAARFKQDPAAARLPDAHAAALLFERPSLRTRTAYEVAMMRLGGRAIVFEKRFDQREGAADVAQTLSHLVSVMVGRVREHDLLRTLAEAASIPVINALSNREHPVEVLADALALRERWDAPAGRRLVYLGDGNNICHSLLFLAPLLGMDVAVAGPAGYEPEATIVARARELAEEPGTSVDILTDPRDAVFGADAVYADAWASMGQEASVEQRRKVFGPYQVNQELMSLAHADAVFLHCLPARRGEEVTAEVIDGPQSLAFQRLDNLAPVTAAVLYWLLSG